MQEMLQLWQVEREAAGHMASTEWKPRDMNVGRTEGALWDSGSMEGLRSRARNERDN